MSKDTIIKAPLVTTREFLERELRRLQYFEERRVATYRDYERMGEIKRRLVEIDYEEKQRFG